MQKRERAAASAGRLSAVGSKFVKHSFNLSVGTPRVRFSAPFDKLILQANANYPFSRLLCLYLGINALFSPPWIHLLSTQRAYDASPTNRRPRSVPATGRPAHPGVSHPGGQISEIEVVDR